MANEACFAVTFRDFKSGEVVTLRAREIRDSQLGIAFVAIGGFVWDRTSLVVNPAEEALQRRFEHTKTLHLSIHAVHMIEELGLESAGLQLEADRTKVVAFPPPGSNS